MGDPVSIGMMVLSTAVSAYSSMQQGKASASAANFERAQYEENRKIAEIQALDEESDRRKRLAQVMSSNKAAAAGMGISTEGRSFLSIQEDSAAEADRDVGRIRLNAKSTSYKYSLASQQSAMEAKSATKSGYLGAGTTLLKGGQDIYSGLKKT